MGRIHTLNIQGQAVQCHGIKEACQKNYAAHTLRGLKKRGEKEGKRGKKTRKEKKQTVGHGKAEEYL